MRAFAWASAAVLALSSAPGAGAAPDEAYARKPPKYTGEQYPQGALRCESTMTRPGYELICPEDRNEWCVKEVVTLEQENCGRSAYFGDMWDPVEKACIYKKCASECVEGRFEFEYAAETYYRDKWCCNDENFCNGASGTSLAVAALLVALAAAR